MPLNKNSQVVFLNFLYIMGLLEIPPQDEKVRFQNHIQFQGTYGPLQPSPISHGPQFKNFYCTHYFNHWESEEWSYNHQELVQGIRDLCIPSLKKKNLTTIQTLLFGGILHHTRWVGGNIPIFHGRKGQILCLLLLGRKATFLASHLLPPTLILEKVWQRYRGNWKNHWRKKRESRIVSI